MKAIISLGGASWAVSPVPAEIDELSNDEVLGVGVGHLLTYKSKSNLCEGKSQLVYMTGL